MTLKNGDELLSVVRIVIAENLQGSRVVVVGEPTEPNSYIFYNGLEGDQMIFWLVQGAGSPTDEPTTDTFRSAEIPS